MSRVASRMGRLGTETAMASSVEAGAHAAAGNRVFPFHLGDLSLPAPAPVREAVSAALEAGHTGYCPAAGIPALREALAGPPVLGGALLAAHPLRREGAQVSDEVAHQVLLNGLLGDIRGVGSTEPLRQLEGRLRLL